MHMTTAMILTTPIMKMPRTAVLLAALAVAPLAGCGGGAAQRIEPGSSLSVRGLDPGKTNEVATSMIDSMLRHPALNPPAGGPVLMSVSNVRADISDRQFRTESLTGTIRSELNKSGKVQLLAVGGADMPNIEASRDAAVAAGYGDRPSIPRPDYRLDGWITEYLISAGKNRAMEHKVHMRLVDPQTGIAVWEDEKAVAAAGRRDRIGF